MNLEALTPMLSRAKATSTPKPRQLSSEEETLVVPEIYDPEAAVGKLRPNKKICVFRVTDLKILGRVGMHIFFSYFFSGKIISCILKGISPFKMH